MELSIKRHGITITETSGGLEVEQNGRSYLAREWTLSRQVYGLIRDAIGKGFICLWTDKNPQKSRQDASYICFSRSHKDPSELKLNKEGHKKSFGESTVTLITVNKIYKEALKTEGICLHNERQSGGSHEIELKPLHFNKALDVIAQQPHPGHFPL